MRDRIGNRLQKGQLVMWVPQQLTVEVLEVDDGTREIEVPGQQPEMYASISVKLTVPYSRQGLRPGAEMMVPDFIQVVNPKHQEALESAMDKMPGPALLPKRKPS